MVSWLEKHPRLAPGIHVELKKEEGLWEVLEVGTTVLEESYMKERANDYRHTRKASDI